MALDGVSSFHAHSFCVISGLLRSPAPHAPQPFLASRAMHLKPVFFAEKYVVLLLKGLLATSTRRSYVCCNGRHV